MIEYLKFFFNLGHLFSVRPGAMQMRAIIILAVIFGLFIIFGFFSKLKAKKINDGLKSKAWQRLYYLGVSMGIIGFVYIFFAWQGVALLAARFWLLIWMIVIIVWLVFIAKYLYIQVPKLRKNINTKRDFEKYVP